MSSAPAYRYDHAAARPDRYRESAPSVRVVPGRKHTVYPTLSDGAVLGIKALIACVIVFLVIGFVRVGLSSAAYRSRAIYALRSLTRVLRANRLPCRKAFFPIPAISAPRQKSAFP